MKKTKKDVVRRLQGFKESLEDSKILRESQREAAVWNVGGVFSGLYAQLKILTSDFAATPVERNVVGPEVLHKAEELQIAIQKRFDKLRTPYDKRNEKLAQQLTKQRVQKVKLTARATKKRPKPRRTK